MPETLAPRVPRGARPSALPTTFEANAVAARSRGLCYTTGADEPSRLESPEFTVAERVMAVVTRFAPSPTGILHIGGARTALFNWLFARHHAGGRFVLRIEDTDRARSTDEANDAIVNGLRWLGLDWDGEAVSQFAHAGRHAEVARALLAEGRAYHCYATPEELAEMRETARREGRSTRYDGRWRERDPAEAPPGIDPVIRLKMPRDGQTVVADHVQGEVEVANRELDDMIVMRADGTPTYMLAVVVDDHDSGVSHVIRGDDHLTNTFRQVQLYRALDWDPPEFAHIPLIHGPDGAKLSKRHGAMGLAAYRESGFLPEAMRNYLLRLGWSHGDDEIVDTDQAIAWFGFDGIGRSPARFDMARLVSLNAHYLRECDDRELTDLVIPRLGALLDGNLADDAVLRVMKGMPGLKARAKTVVELADNAVFLARTRPVPLGDDAARILDGEARERLGRLVRPLDEAPDWNARLLEDLVRRIADEEGVKLGVIAQPLRAALTGATASPPIFEVMDVLGRNESLGRLADALGTVDRNG